MKIITFIIMFVLFCAGMLLMGYSFNLDSYQAEAFLGGILLSSLSIAIPAHILPRLD